MVPVSLAIVRRWLKLLLFVAVTRLFTFEYKKPDCCRNDEASLPEARQPIKPDKPFQTPKDDKSLNVTNSIRSEEHTSELKSLMRISYAVLCLTKKNIILIEHTHTNTMNLTIMS